MATAQDVPLAAVEPTETVPPLEPARRLMLMAIGWWLLAEFSAVIAVLFAIVIGIAIGEWKLADVRNPALLPLLGTVGAWAAACALLIAVRTRSAIVGQGNRRAGVGDGPITRWWLLAVLALPTIAWAFIVGVFMNAVSPQSVTNWRGHGPSLAAFAVVAILLAPLAEELFYRGWLWTGLRQHWRVFPTALFACGFWLVSHIDRGALVPILLIPTAVILGIARQFCGIRAAIILHAAHNLVSVLVIVSALASP